MGYILKFNDIEESNALALDSGRLGTEFSTQGGEEEALNIL